MIRTQSGFTLIELMMVVAIIGILALMSGAMVMDAASKAREGAVKSNVSAAYSSVLTKINLGGENSIDDLVEESIEDLNNPDGVEGTKDEVHSPYSSNLAAYVFDTNASAGQVSLEVIDDYTVRISGYGQEGSSSNPLIVKTVQKVMD